MTELAASRVDPTARPARVRKRIHWLAYALVVPIILYEGLLIVYPIAQGIYGSFTRIELASKNPPVWVGWDNYRRMFNDPGFWQVIQTTLTFTALVILVALGAGLFTALLFNRPFRARPIARGMMMMPWALPEVPVVMIFIWILSPQFGVVNILARSSSRPAAPRRMADMTPSPPHHRHGQRQNQLQTAREDQPGGGLRDGGGGLADYRLSGLLDGRQHLPAQQVHNALPSAPLSQRD